MGIASETRRTPTYSGERTPWAGPPKPKKGENSSGGADVSAAKAIKPNVAEEVLRCPTRDGQSAYTVEEIAVPPRHLARSLRQSAAGTEQVSVR